jgi:spermidine synthase
MMLGLFVCLSLPILFFMKEYMTNRASVYFICFTLLFVIALLVGGFFSMSSQIQSDKTRVVAAKVYASDLLGSASGALLTSVILIPKFGLYTTVVMTGGLSFITMLLIFLKRKLRSV